jgi:hypothetical protein
LIFSLIADRLDYLFAHRREAVGHILDLLEPAASNQSMAAQFEKVAASADHLRQALSVMASEGTADTGADEVDVAIARINAAAAEINLLALKSSARALSAGPGAAREPVEGTAARAEPGKAAAA